jgi:hypothetical protein
MDGFGKATDPIQNLNRVVVFREQLQRDQMVSFFETPADLEARLSAAVASVGLRSQMLKNSALLHGQMESMAASIPITDSGRIPLGDLVSATPPPEVAHIDIRTKWWSTQLYILAVVADLLTDVRRIVIKEGTDFVGIASTQCVRTMLRLVHPEIDRFEKQAFSPELPASHQEALSEILRRWREVLGEQEGQFIKEQAVQMTVTRNALIRWLGDGFQTSAVRVEDPDQTNVLDLLRVLDYPNEFVPIVSESSGRNTNQGTQPTPLRVINKAMLNAQLAKSHIDDMLTALGLRYRRGLGVPSAADSRARKLTQTGADIVA